MTILITYSGKSTNAAIITLHRTTPTSLHILPNLLCLQTNSQICPAESVCDFAYKMRSN